MHAHLRRSLAPALALFIVAGCGDDPGPGAPVVGLPESLTPVSVQTPKNTAVEAIVPVSTIDGRSLTYTVVSGPAHGAVQITDAPAGARVRYTPTTGFAGQDQIDFRVGDGVSTVDGRVDVTVLNAVPTVTGVALRRPAQGPFTFEVSGTDPDGDALTFEVVDAPGNGTVSAFSAAGSPSTASGPQAAPATTVAQATYTPNQGYLGDESFTFRAHDGNDPSSPATVSLIANRLPTLEVEEGMPVVVRRNAPTRLHLTILDADGDPVSSTVGTAPAQGTLGAFEPTSAGFDVLYTPTPGYAGTDVFTVLLDDGLDVAPVEVALTVVNEAPVAFNVSQTGFVGSDLVVDLTGADADGDPLVFEIVAGPAVGTLGAVTSTGPTTAKVTYSPGAAPAGAQSFTFRVSDGVAFSAPATATVVLITEAPIATATTAQTPEDTPVVIALSGIDQQGDALTFAIVSGPSHGTLGPITSLGLYTAQVTYTPNANYSGADLFTFTVFDGTHTSLPAAVGINVLPVDDPPIVVASPVEAFTTGGNTTLQFAPTRTVMPSAFVAGDLLDNFIDAEGDGLTISLEAATVTAGASVTLNADGSFTYTPPLGRTAPDTFDYTVTDGTTPVTRTVTVSFNGMIWYVDDTFGGTPDGRSVAPFTSLGAAATAAGPNDIIFVYEGNSATTPLAGGFTFQAGQQLIGQPEGLTTAQGVIVAPGGSLPTVTNAAGAGVTLASGSTLAGFVIAAPTGAGIAAAGVAGATVRNVAVTTPGAEGIDLDIPTGSWTFTGVTVTGAVGNAFDVAGGDAFISSGGDITNSAGRSVQITGITGGGIALSGSIADTGAGIDISGNSGGTITLSGAAKVINTGANAAVALASNTGAVIDFTGGGLDIDVTSGTGFTATGGGTVTVQGAGNSVTATTGTAVSIVNTSIGAAGAVFQRVDVAGAPSGIVLDQTGAGSFTVTGTGATAGSGGTITGTTGDGVSLNTAMNVTLRNMVIGDPTAAVGQAPDATNLVGTAGAGSGIVAIDVTGAPGLTLTNVLVSRTADHGLAATRLGGLVISGSSFLNNGDGAGDDALHFGASGGPDGLFGTASVTSTTVDGFAGAGLVVHNATGALALSLSGNSFANNQAGIGAANGSDGVTLVPAGSATMTVGVSGASSFDTLVGAGVNAAPVGSASLDLTVQNSTFNETNSAAGAVRVFAAGTSSTRADISSNTIAASAGSGVYLEESGGSTLDATVSNNAVGSLGVPNSGAEAGNGISIIHGGAGLSRFLLSSNALNSHEAAGIYSINADAGASGGIDSEVTLTGNTVAAPETGASIGGIQVATSSTHGLCTQITGNTSAGAGGATGIEVQQNNTSVFGVVGLTASALTIAPYLASVNAATAADLGGAYVDAGVASCTAPTPPILP